jgi:hypothetical protein
MTVLRLRCFWLYGSYKNFAALDGLAQKVLDLRMKQYGDKSREQLASISVRKCPLFPSLAGVKTGKDLDIEKLTTNLRMAPDGLKADNFVAVVPNLGNLVGAGTIDSKNALDFKMAATLTNAVVLHD